MLPTAELTNPHRPLGARHPLQAVEGDYLGRIAWRFGAGLKRLFEDNKDKIKALDQSVAGLPLLVCLSPSARIVINGTQCLNSGAKRGGQVTAVSGAAPSAAAAACAATRSC